MHRGVLRGVLAGVLFTTGSAQAASVVVDMHAIDARGVQDRIGQVSLQDSEQGLVLEVKVRSIPPGAHGFHVHQNPNCGAKQQEGKAVPGGAAGGHYDPKNAGRHEGPHRDGHLGDLPVLRASGGNVETRLVAPRLRLADVRGRSLMIHAGPDNYSDAPKPLGGGGGRIACGVIG